METASPASSANGPTAGGLLRTWRNRAGLSQLELSLETGVSTRHISYVETGRAQPSRRMIVRLAAQLDVPLRERNRLLLAAGYAPIYRRTPLSAPTMRPARETIDRVLRAHEPFPALVFTTSWQLVSANRPLWWLLEGLPERLLQAPVNVMRIALHPEGLITRVRDPAAWHHHLHRHLRRAAAATANPELIELEREISTYPVPNQAGDQRADPDALFVTLRFHHRGTDLDFISTLAMFGTPLDLTPAELIIESLYPANRHTAQEMTKSTYSGRSASDVNAEPLPEP